MYAENDGVKIFYEVHGSAEPTLVMVPGFQIAHSQMFIRNYVPFLSRHMSVVTLDLRGSGKSDKPDGGYDLETYVADLHAVVRSSGFEEVAMAGISYGVPIIIKYHATHPGIANRLVFINGFARMERSDDYPEGIPKEALQGALAMWRKRPEVMTKSFIDLVCSEKNSLRNKELLWDWAHESTHEVLYQGYKCTIEPGVDRYLKDIHVPTLILHAKQDGVVFPSASKYLHRHIPGSELHYISDSGHGLVHAWPQVARHVLNFLKPGEFPRAEKKSDIGRHKVLWISSPIGMGHAKRDLAIVSELRKGVPGIQVDWLALDPVRTYLKSLGERVHPLSHALWDENGHIESYGKDYRLDITEAYWEMDQLRNNNFMVFLDAALEENFDLIVGDEAWEVAEYLHYNPSLKTAPFVFLTDFVGVTDVSDDPTKRAHVRDVNGIWVEMREIHPEASDLSIFVGELDDIPDMPFGEGLPNMKAWGKEHFRFSGYVLPFDPADYSDREVLRNQLGYRPQDPVLLVAVGGTSHGRPLIEKCLAAQPALKSRMPRIRTIVLCGPRIDGRALPAAEGVEFVPFVQDPARYYAACDLAVIQGGLSTSMELTVLNRPFLYFPLREHFEQQSFVGFRLDRYNAGVRMDFDATSPEQLADAVAVHMGKAVSYGSVPVDGAKRAASMIADLLKRRPLK